VKLRVGISPCPNDVFIFSGWILGKTSAPAAEFAFEDVETLNGRARAGDGDLLKVSWANVPGCIGYAPLACGGALGRGCGPLLLTGGAEWDPEAEVLVPGARTTANFLLDFWAGRPLRKRFVPFDALYRELKARPTAQGVVIHEMRFTYETDGLRLVRDLGAHWEEMTGHPIPLGAVVRKGSPHVPSAGELEVAIRASLDWAWVHEEEAMELCAKYAGDMNPRVMRAHIGLYVNDYTRDMEGAGRKAIALMAQLLGKK
jgi:1,4-dihydroxy-6-naphthoate synthase